MAQYPFSLNRKTQDWGYRTNIPEDKYHKGLDFGVAAGSIVACAAAGTVTIVSRSGSYNYFKQVDHGVDAQGRRWWTRYHMLGSVAGPQEGDRVEQGQTIGISGPKFGVSTGEHHHFEIHTDSTLLHTPNFGTSVDPEKNLERLPTGAVVTPIPEEEKMKPILVSTPQGSSSTLVDWWVISLQDRTYWHIDNQSQLEFTRNSSQVLNVTDKQAPAILAGLRQL